MLQISGFLIPESLSGKARSFHGEERVPLTFWCSDAGFQDSLEHLGSGESGFVITAARLGFRVLDFGFL